MASTRSRRRFLGELGASALLGALPFGRRAWAGGELYELATRPENYEAPLEALTQRITPLESFYIRSHFDRPAIDAATWRLTIDGLAGKVQSFSLADLRRFEQVSVEAVLQCAGNGRALFRPRMPGVQWKRGAMGNAVWRGVRLRDLLKRAAPKSEAEHLILTGADKPALPTAPALIRSIPMEKALHPDTLIALEMNGVPLPPSHGFPARVVVPGWVGDDWIKWISQLTLSAEEAKGFFFEKAYRFPDPPGAPGEPVPPERMHPMTRLAVKSAITQPLRGATLAAGAQEIAGVAFSGEAAIKKVEISIDGGKSWAPAKLEGKASRYAWQIWRAKVKLDRPGPVRILSRATDDRGDTQPEQPRWNPSGYLYNAVDDVDVEVKVKV
ncbi:MAG: sulfite oxidase [Deltaproteobacteria bacterium]|nr:sulfite oxidase [Deltaproteobacteria bacterium]